jgi:hypothetical protein
LNVLYPSNPQTWATTIIGIMEEITLEAVPLRKEERKKPIFVFYGMSSKKRSLRT